jgi:hypothetical protein
MVTETPLKEVGDWPFTKSEAVHDRVTVDKPEPNTVIQAPDAMPGRAANVAPLTTDVMIGDAV